MSARCPRETRLAKSQAERADELIRATGSQRAHMLAQQVYAHAHAALSAIREGKMCVDVRADYLEASGPRLRTAARLSKSGDQDRAREKRRDQRRRQRWK